MGNAGEKMRKIEFYKDGKLCAREYDEDSQRAVAIAKSWLEDDVKHEARIFTLFERKWHKLFESSSLEEKGNAKN